MARHEQPPAPRGEAGRARRFWYPVALGWTWLWGLLTVGVLCAAVPQWLGLEPGVTGEDIQGGVLAAIVSVALTGLGWFAVQEPDGESSSPPTPRRQDPRPWLDLDRRPRLPRPESTARQPMRHLTNAEVVLADLLRKLSDVRGESADDMVEHTWHVATDTAAGLRSVAARLEAVELATKHAPASKRAALDEAASTLRRHLDQGVDGYRGLIAAVGLLLANTPVVDSDELVEATESLAGLAEALHELSGPNKNE